MGSSSEQARRFPDPGQGLERLQDAWSAIVAVVQACGGTVDASSVQGRAPHDLGQARLQLQAVAPVPDGVVELLERVPHARLAWRLRDVPDRRWASWGDVRWSVSDVVRAEQHRRQWVEEVFDRPNAPYDAVWQGSFGLVVLDNDDVIGVETSSGRVVYVSHDDAEAHGVVLGSTIVDFLRRWTQIGCPGPDGCAWEQFTGPDGIDSDGAEALQWLEWLMRTRETNEL